MVAPDTAPVPDYGTLRPASADPGSQRLTSAARDAKGRGAHCGTRPAADAYPDRKQRSADSARWVDLPAPAEC